MLLVDNINGSNESVGEKDLSKKKKRKTLVKFDSTSVVEIYQIAGKEVLFLIENVFGYDNSVILKIFVISA